MHHLLDQVKLLTFSWLKTYDDSLVFDIQFCWHSPIQCMGFMRDDLKCKLVCAMALTLF